MKTDKQLLDRTKQIVLKYNNYSPSFLQRKLQIGYGLAASLIDTIPIFFSMFGLLPVMSK